MKSLLNTLNSYLSELEGLAIHVPTLQVKPISLDLTRMVKEYCQFLSALKSCRKVAEKETGKVLQQEKMLTEQRDYLEKLRKEMSGILFLKNSSTANKYGLDECGEMLQKTMDKYSLDFQNMLQTLKAKMNQLAEEMGEFKVVLFGRTKVGKSTVREALTQGNGETIGKGGQSTTLEIHKYNWFNLQIYDTPGILSVRDTKQDERGIGEEERKAGELLSHADIAIFMFASDNIEEAEREYLRKIASQGKDVLILLNVKSDISDYRMYKLRHKERELTPASQAGNLKRITEVLPPNNSLCEILPVHAQAAYFSRAKGNPAVEDFYRKYQVDPNELYDLSHFSGIREYIVRNIHEKGNWIRCKTIWGVFIQALQELALENRNSIERALETVKDLMKRVEHAQKKTELIITKHKEALYDNLLRLAKERISTYNYAQDCIELDRDKESIRSGWEMEMEKLKELPQILLQDFQEEIQAIMNELVNECKFVTKCASDFEGYEIGIDWNQWLKVGGWMAGGLATVLAVGAWANFWNPVGWVAGALAILGAFFGWLAGLFKSKQRKIADLNAKLVESLETACRSIEGQMVDFCEHGTEASEGKQAKKGVFEVIRQKLQDIMDKQNRLLELCAKFLQLNDGLLAKADTYKQELAKLESQLTVGATYYKNENKRTIE